MRVGLRSERGERGAWVGGGGEGGQGVRGRLAIILTRTVASRELVAGRCEVAFASGVREGMDLAHARSLVPARVVVHVEPYRVDRVADRLHALACWAVRFSPLVAVDPPDGLLIDVTGTERLHKGESRLVRAVVAGLNRLGFAARVCAASTFGCAWGVARYGEYGLSRIAPGREREAMEPLPVESLRVEAGTVRALGEVGITNVGHVLNVSRASLAARFGPELLSGVRRALGEEREHIEPVRPAEPSRSVLHFDGPTDHVESVEAAAARVLEELVGMLAARERGVRRLDVEVLRPRAAAVVFSVVLSRPSRNGKHLWTLVRARLERVDLGEGVEGVVMTAVRTARLRHEQSECAALGAGEQGAGEGAWGELIDTLAGRLGADNVTRACAAESHLPERAFCQRSVMEPVGRVPVRVTSADRPTVLFDQPERGEVMALTPDGPVLSLKWRGERVRVVRCLGPERIGVEWWRGGVGDGPARAGRDYFTAQTDGGRWLWLFRSVGTGEWFVHGEWG